MQSRLVNARSSISFFGNQDDTALRSVGLPFNRSFACIISFRAIINIFAAEFGSSLAFRTGLINSPELTADRKKQTAILALTKEETTTQNTSFRRPTLKLITEFPYRGRRYFVFSTNLITAETDLATQFDRGSSEPPSRLSPLDTRKPSEIASHPPEHVRQRRNHRTGYRKSQRPIQSIVQKAASRSHHMSRSVHSRTAATRIPRPRRQNLRQTPAVPWQVLMVVVHNYMGTYLSH